MIHLKEASVAAIIPAAGSGRRFGAEQNKLFATLAGEPLWVHSVRKLQQRPEIGRIILSVSEQDLTQFQQQLASVHDVSEGEPHPEWVLGGEERADSVQAALQALQGDSNVEWVAVHDAARPLVTDQDLDKVFAAVPETDAAILAGPVSGTLKRDLGVGQQQPTETVDRKNLWIAFTPQVFRLGLLEQAYAKHNGCPATDDAQLVERVGGNVQLISGSAENLKITFPEDLSLAEAILSRKK